MDRRLRVVLLPVLILAACGGNPPGPAASSSSAITGTLSVFAAASLTESFKSLGTDFQATHPNVTLRFNFAGTPTLVTQIEQGASADVFASADTSNMEKLKSDGDIEGSASIFAHNKLEIVVAAGNPKGIDQLADLAKPGIVYISEAPSVPAGKYSLQALAKAKVSVTPRSLESDVKSVVSKIELGEADAGIVYVTDVKAAGAKVEGVPIAEQDNVLATYPIAVVKGASNSAAARAFIAYIESADGQVKLESFGFSPAASS
jgi:molybdate transport system substrate-binding protein